MVAIVSFLAMGILGGGGIFLYLMSNCWVSGNECAAYNPVGIFVAYILSWPIFLMQKLFFKSMENISNFDPVVFGKCGWLALWFYYYLLVSIVVKLFDSKSNRNQPNNLATKA
jgi:hypothetical protein